jgi:membrane protein DedA with SNARE-associated domain
VIVTADLAGDSIYYALGYFSRKNFIQKWWHLIGITPDKLKNLENHFEKHQFKTLIIGKITHAVGAIVLVAAGMAKVPYKKFILFNLLATIPKSLILILSGFYFGHAYKKLDRFLDYSVIIILFAAVSFILIYFLTKKLAKLLNSSKQL